MDVGQMFGFMESTVQDTSIRVALQGRLYREEAFALRRHLTECVEQYNKDLIVDYSAVEYIDRTVMETMVILNKRAEKQGVRLVITGLQGTVKELFELIRLSKILDIQ